LDMGSSRADASPAGPQAHLAASSSMAGVARSSSLAGMAHAGLGLVRKLGSIVANSFRSGSGSRVSTAAGESAVQSFASSGTGGSVSGANKRSNMLKDSKSSSSIWSLSGMKSLVTRGSQQGASAATSRGTAVSLTGWAEGSSSIKAPAETTTASLSGWEAGAVASCDTPAIDGRSAADAQQSSAASFSEHVLEGQKGVDIAFPRSAPPVSAAAAPVKAGGRVATGAQGIHAEPAGMDALEKAAASSGVPSPQAQPPPTRAVGKVEPAEESIKPTPPNMPQQEQQQVMQMHPPSAKPGAMPAHSPRVVRQQQQQVLKGSVMTGQTAFAAKPEALGTLMAAAGLLGGPSVGGTSVLGPAITIAPAGPPDAWVSNGVADSTAALAGVKLGASTLNKSTQQQQQSKVESGPSPRALEPIGPGRRSMEQAPGRQQQLLRQQQASHVGAALQPACQTLQKASGGSGALGYRRQTVHECVEELRIATTSPTAPAAAVAASAPGYASSSKLKSLAPPGGIFSTRGVVMEKGPASVSALQGVGMGGGGGLKVGSWLGATAKPDASTTLGSGFGEGAGAAEAASPEAATEQLGVLAPGSRVAGVLGAGNLGSYVLQSKNHRLQSMYQEQHLQGPGRGGDEAGAGRHMPQSEVPLPAAHSPAGRPALVATLTGKKALGKEDGQQQQQVLQRVQQPGKASFSILGVGRGPPLEAPAIAAGARHGVTGAAASVSATAKMRPASVGPHQLAGSAGDVKGGVKASAVALPAIVINKRRTTVGALPERPPP
jgi:hypothetical protein